ncbi:glucose dehydrogenase [FAD, quinone]-like [Diaphorina citri]|uniref:Glucose dehydrogenase [FAD, quinone]-like n=1 Tax=Diaphorina citri TaxID=121845 RepID=A0A3Q0J626_DIACI|nr:glucose dehydrogenase [FAD, quinone]-like [Diaphorina citri]
MGGTTVLNGLMYCRGDSSDYDEYEKLGATGWGYKNVLPYFLKSEHNLQYNSSQNHARGGLLTVSHYNDLPDLGHTLLAAGRELGYPTDVDIGHGRLREGFYRAQMTTRNGARLSAAKAFVRPFLHRSNLKVLLNAQVGYCREPTSVAEWSRALTLNPEVLGSNSGQGGNFLTKLFLSWIGMDVNECALQ